MIPGIVFVGLSTKDTGQVINIELPLGIAIIGFFVGYGIGIYRKSLSKKQEERGLADEAEFEKHIIGCLYAIISDMPGANQ